MATWNFDPSMYEERDFQIIPVGDHRVRIEDVVEKTFNSGNVGYEITLAVNGYNSKIWHYLVLDRTDPKKTNQRIGDFFNSFGISETSLGSGKQWIGKVGAVRVKHEEYNGSTNAKVAYVINRKNQDKLAPWRDADGGAPVNANANASQEELPF